MPDTIAISESSVLESSGSFSNLVLSQLRVAFVRSRIVSNEIATIGSALRGGHIGPETALAMLHESGLDWITEPLS